MESNTNARLMALARDSAQNAYCRYSQFPVGAAARTAGGEVFTGTNVENASYGLTVCAERTAIFAAVSQGHRRFEALAVTCLKGDAKQPESLMPCGACRQVMAEFFDAETEILVDGVRTFRLGDLLPQPFRLPRDAGDE